MRSGFKFKNKHSSEFGITVRTKSRPIRPETKSVTVDLPCRDGVYDFSKANPMGREYFYERVITVSISIVSPSLEAMQNKLSAVARWLTGEGELVFDDMPYTVWRGRVSDEIIYLPEHAGKTAVLEISFRVQPFSVCAFSSKGPELDFAVPLDANIPIGIDAYLKGTVSGNGSVDILNFGDRPVRPVIKITGAAEDIIMNCGGKTLSFSVSGNTSVDCENQNVTDSGGYAAVSGEFFELQQGVNTLQLENSNTSILDIEVSYLPQFMYAVDFDAIDWSVDNA